MTTMVKSLDITLDEITEKVNIYPEVLDEAEHSSIDAMYALRIDELPPKYLCVAYEDARRFGCEKEFIKKLVGSLNLESSKARSYYAPVCERYGYVIDGDITYIPMKYRFESEHYFGYEYCDGRQFIFDSKLRILCKKY